jgi:hypothetical protein
VIDLLALRTGIANDLADPYFDTWSDDLVDQWLKDGLREIAQTLPYHTTGVVELETGTTSYDLPVLLAQYVDSIVAPRQPAETDREVVPPGGIDPPGDEIAAVTLRVTMIGVTRVTYASATNEAQARPLCRLSEDAPEFGLGCYDLLPTTFGYTLLLGWLPDAGHDSLTIYYTTLYPEPAVDADPIMLPPQALEALKRFCIWKAWLHRMNITMQDPPDNSILPSVLSMAVGRAERSYKQALELIATANQASPPGRPRRPDRFRGNRWA